MASNSIFAGFDNLLALVSNHSCFDLLLSISPHPPSLQACRVKAAFACRLLYLLGSLSISNTSAEDPQLQTLILPTSPQCTTRTCTDISLKMLHLLSNRCWPRFSETLQSTAGDVQSFGCISRRKICKAKVLRRRHRSTPLLA